MSMTSSLPDRDDNAALQAHSTDFTTDQLLARVKVLAEVRSNGFEYQNRDITYFIRWHARHFRAPMHVAVPNYEKT